MKSLDAIAAQAVMQPFSGRLIEHLEELEEMVRTQGIQFVGNEICQCWLCELLELPCEKCESCMARTQGMQVTESEKEAVNED